MKIYCPGCGNPLHSNEISCSVCGHKNPKYGKDVENNNSSESFKYENESYNNILDEQKVLNKANLLGTISFFLICTFPLAGIIVSAIGIKTVKKIHPDVPGRSISYGLNVFCLIIAIIIFVVQTYAIGTFIASFQKIYSSNEPEDTITVEGHYKCIERESKAENIDYKMLLYLEKDGRFAITIYDGVGFDQAFGNYVYTPINRNNESQEYKYYSIILKGDQNGYTHYEEIQDYPYISSLEFGLKKVNKQQEGTVTLQNGNEYYCFLDK